MFSIEGLLDFIRRSELVDKPINIALYKDPASFVALAETAMI